MRYSATLPVVGVTWHVNNALNIYANAGIEVINAGKLYANDGNAAQASGYTLMNLKASHAWPVGQGSLTAYARLDNATDRRYVGSVIVNQAMSQFYEPAPGRNWTAGLRLDLPF